MLFRSLIVSNLKATLTASIEMANGSPDGGWDAIGASLSPDPGSKAGAEVESLTVGFAYAF